MGTPGRGLHKPCVASLSLQEPYDPSLGYPQVSCPPETVLDERRLQESVRGIGAVLRRDFLQRAAGCGGSARPRRGNDHRESVVQSRSL